MLKNGLYIFLRVMVVSVTAVATAEAVEVMATGEAVQDEPSVEVVYIDMGPDETIECIAVDPGYAFLDGNGDEQFFIEEYLDQSKPQPIMVSAYTFEQGGLPMQVDEHTFGEVDLALDGHAKVELGPFWTYPNPNIFAIPDEQIVTVNTGDGVQVVMLENSLDPDVDVSCTIFALEYYTDPTGSVVKKKVAKKKVAKANKKRVKKKAAKKKAAAKRKKALNMALEIDQ